MVKIIDNLAVQVSVETILQKALVETAEQVLKKHGARLNYVSFEWLDGSSSCERSEKVVSCEINTTYKP